MHTGERQLDLIHRGSEGKLSDKERSELEDILTADVSARKQYETLRKLHESLSRVTPEEAPPGIVENVMNTISKQTNPTIVSDITESTSRSRVLGYSLVFAGGLAAGLACFFLFNESSQSLKSHDSNLSGAMIFEETQPGSLVETADFSVGDFFGSFEIVSHEELIQIRIKSSSQSRCAIVIDVSDSHIKPLGIERGSTHQLDFSMSDDLTRIFTEGQNSFSVMLNRNSEIVSTITVRAQSGAEFWEKTIRLNP